MPAAHRHITAHPELVRSSPPPRRARRSDSRACRAPRSATEVQTISGIGDQAFFQVYPNDSNPFIWVLKDSTAFVIRLITLPPKAFTLDEEKDKETVLAKAALGHL